MAPKRLWFIVVFLGALAALLFLAEWLPRYQASDTQSVPDHLIRVDCNLSSKVCPIRLGDLRMALSLEPNGLPALTPLVLSISDTSAAINSAESWLVWFAGRDMDMGLHLMAPMSPAAKPEAGDAREREGSILYSGLIPVCAIDRSMVWLLNVQFVWRSELYRFVFPAPVLPH